MSQRFIGLEFDGKTYWAKSECKAAVMELSKLLQLPLVEEKELEDIPADRKNKFFRKNAKWVTLIRKANTGVNPIPTDKYWSYKEQSENIEDIHSLEVTQVPIGLPEGVPYGFVSATDKRIIQIRGTNGSGKSFSINKALKTDPNAYLVVPVGRKNHQAFCTVLPAYRTVLLGPYQPTMGSGGY